MKKIIYLSALKKIKISAIKKSDSSQKSSKTDKTQLSIDKKDEDLLVNKGDEPYKCTGKFIEDFQNICKKNHINYVPQMIHRHKRVHSPPIQNIETKLSENNNNIISRQKMTKIKHNLSLLEPQSDLIHQSSGHNQKNSSILSLNDDENFKEGTTFL